MTLTLPLVTASLSLPLPAAKAAAERSAAAGRRMTSEDALTQTLLNGHVMSTFAVDPDLTGRTSICRAGGPRMFPYIGEAIIGPPVMLPGAIGRELVPPTRRV